MSKELIEKCNVLAQRVEKLEADRDALAAELKALREQEPVAWFCHSNDGGYYEFSTFQAAAGCASDELAECRAQAKHDGEWPEDVVSIKFGAVLGHLTELKGETDGEGWVDYQLIWPVPAEPVNQSRPLESIESSELRLELHLRAGPRYQCQSKDCKSYEDGPGQFDTCPGCARKGYLCGSFVLDKNSTQYQQWVERTRDKYRGKSGQKNQSPEAGD